MDCRLRGNDGQGTRAKGMTEVRTGLDSRIRGNDRSEHEDDHVRMFREACSRGGGRTLRVRPARAGPQMNRQDNTTKAQTTFVSSPPSISPGFPAGRFPFPVVTTPHMKNQCLLSRRKSVILKEVHGRLRVLKGAPELPSARAIAPPSRACGRSLPWDSALAARRIV
jgi:hypothetical protein